MTKKLVLFVFLISISLTFSSCVVPRRVPKGKWVSETPNIEMYFYERGLATGTYMKEDEEVKLYVSIATITDHRLHIYDDVLSSRDDLLTDEMIIFAGFYKIDGERMILSLTFNNSELEVEKDLQEIIFSKQ